MAKFCPNCGKEIQEGADVCVNCGKMPNDTTINNQKPKKKMPTWLIVILVIIGIGIIGSALSDDEKTTNNSSTNNINNTPTDTSTTNENQKETTTTQPQRKGVYLEDGHYGYSDDYGFAYYIEGYVKNDSTRKYSYIQIEFNTYDAEGNTLGSCLANNSGLEADGRWKFKAICSGDAKSVASYKFDKISKW